MSTGSAAKIQAAIYAGYGVAGKVLGEPVDVYRPLAGQPPLTPANKIASLAAQFTNGKASGFSFDKGATYEDLLFTTLVDGTQVEVGDYLVAATATFFVAAMPPNLPISCVQCNAVISLSRNATERVSAGGAPLPSQAGGAGRYFGPSTRQVSVGAGETPLVSDVPVAVIGSTGRATPGNSDLPADAPGPSRWRVHIPMSVCPHGFIKDRDLMTDDQAYRYLVSAAAWTSLGYRAETIRLEN